MAVRDHLNMRDHSGSSVVKGDRDGGGDGCCDGNGGGDGGGDGASTVISILSDTV